MDDENPRASLAWRLADDASRMLGSLYLGKALLVVLASSVAALMLLPPLSDGIQQLGLPEHWALIAGLAIVASLLGVMIVVVGRLVPEAVSAAEPEQWALRLVWLVYAVELIFWPVVRLLVWVSNRLARPFGGTPFSGTSLITEEEIRMLVDAGEEEGVIEEDEKQMIYSIFQFGQTFAREVMIPRIDIVALEAKGSLQDALELIIESGYSRIPVYEETVDHILGLLYARDLLIQLQTDEESPGVKDLLRPAYFVPETKKADDLLREMQKRRVHMAIVVDEYGGTAGLVTVEDILEEIVGEIQDEYDAEEPIFEAISDGEYVLDARIDLDDANHLLGTELPTEMGDTLGGFIYGRLGKIPLPGETFRFNGLLIEVLTVTGRRIRKVRVQLAEVEQQDEDI
jgi:CBS domain containing-hemolysin-like protein